ncbi:MAG TPA: hypothetical protein VGJ02_09505 [Pyrinomonadaceae bacterium]
MFRSFGIRAAVGIAFVLCLSTALFADTIRLKDGSLIKGTIVSFAGGRFVIVIGDGARRRELSLDAAEIASIEFDPHSALANRSASSDRQSGAIVPVSTKNPPQVVTSERNPPMIANEVPSDTQQGPTNPSAGNSTPRSTQPVARPSPELATPPSISEMGAAKPISLSLKVLADSTSNGWTNSGFVVKRGQRIRISGDGSVSLGHGNTSTPSGLPDLDDNQKLLKAVPTGALIAVIGDDNNDFIYVGESREFTAARDGALYLGVNEGDLTDNKGSYDVKIEILTDK